MAVNSRPLYQLSYSGTRRAIIDIIAFPSFEVKAKPLLRQDIRSLTSLKNNPGCPVYFRYPLAISSSAVRIEPPAAPLTVLWCRPTKR